MNRDKHSAKKALGSKSAKKRLQQQRVDRFTAELLAESTNTVDSSTSSSTKKSDDNNLTAGDSFQASPSKQTSRQSVQSERLAVHVHPSSATGDEDDVEVDYDEASEDESNEAFYEQPVNEMSEKVAETTHDASGSGDVGFAAQQTNISAQTTLQTPSRDLATKTSRSQQPEGVSSSSKHIPSVQSQENVAEHLDLHEEASEKVATLVPLEDQKRAMQEARKRNFQATHQPSGIVASIARSVLVEHSTRKKPRTEAPPRIESPAEEGTWYDSRHVLLSIRGNILDFDACHREYHEAIKGNIRSGLIEQLYEYPHRFTVEYPYGSGQFVSRVIQAAEEAELTVLEAAYLQFSRETNLFIPEEDNLRYMLIEMIVERRRLAALDKSLLEHPDAYGRYFRTLQRYFRHTPTMQRTGASPEILTDRPPLLQKAPADPNSLRFNAEAQLQRGDLLRQANQKPIPVEGEQLRLSMQNTAAARAKEAELTALVEKEKRDKAWKKMVERFSSTPMSEEQQRDLEESANLFPYFNPDLTPYEPSSGSTPSNAASMVGSQPMRSADSSNRLEQQYSQPSASGVGYTAHGANVVLLQTDPIESFMLDAATLGRGVLLSDIRDLERSYTEARSKHRGDTWTFRNHMSSATIAEIQHYFKAFDIVFPSDWPDQRGSSVAEILQQMKAIFARAQGPSTGNNYNPNTPLWQRIHQVPLTINFGDLFNSIAMYTRQLRMVTTGEASQTGLSQAIRTAFAKHEQLQDPAINTFIQQVFKTKIDTMDELYDQLFKVVQHLTETINLCASLQVTRNPLPTVTTERPKTAPEAESAKRPYVPKQTPATSSNPISAGTSTTSGNSGEKKPRPAPTCNRCNRYPGRKENYQIPHTWTTCPWQGHPCANHEQHVAWADSANGKRWAMVGFKYLPKEFTLDALGNKVPLNPPLQGNYQLLGGTTSTKQKKSCKSVTPVPINTSAGDEQQESLLQTTTLTPSINSAIANSDYIMGYLCSLETDVTAPVTVLLDTGAFNGNYISSRVAKWLVENFHVKIQPCSTTICGANSKWCVKCIGTINFTLNLNTELSSTMLALNLSATILDASFDIVLGRPTIKAYNLVLYYPSHFVHLDKNTRATLAKLVTTCGDSKCIPIDQTASDHRVVDQITPRDVVKPASAPVVHRL